MKYAIIAAGEGSRLMQEGVQLPKPLVRVGGEHLVDRLIRIFLANKADEIVVICNEQMTDVAAHLKDVQRNGLAGKSVPLRLIVKRTPSSMHSLYELSPYLHASPFVLTTVDTVFKEDEFALFVNSMNTALEAGDNGMMAVTDFVDDEKPLYVQTENPPYISGFYDEPAPNCHYISAGIYGLTPQCLPVLRACIERGESRMRNFQRALIANGMKLKAYVMGKVLDIDHVSDINKAEKFLYEQRNCHL